MDRLRSLEDLVGQVEELSVLPVNAIEPAIYEPWPDASPRRGTTIGP